MGNHLAQHAEVLFVACCVVNMPNVQDRSLPIMDKHVKAASCCTAVYREHRVCTTTGMVPRQEGSQSVHGRLCDCTPAGTLLSRTCPPSHAQVRDASSRAKRAGYAWHVEARMTACR